MKTHKYTKVLIFLHKYTKRVSKIIYSGLKLSISCFVRFQNKNYYRLCKTIKSDNAV